MIGFEKILPKEYQLEYRLGECGDLLESTLSDIRKSSLFGDVIDWTTFRQPHYYAVNKLTQIVGVDNSYERETMHRAGFFAWQTHYMVFGGNKGLSLPDYVTVDQSIDVIRELVHQDAQEYLGSRPLVDGFLWRYMGELDQGRTYPHKAEMIAATVFRAGEVWMGEDLFLKGLNDQIIGFEG